MNKPKEEFSISEEFVEPVIVKETVLVIDEPFVLEEDKPFDVNGAVQKVKDSLFPNEHFLDQPMTHLHKPANEFKLEEEFVNPTKPIEISNIKQVEETPEQFIEEDFFAEAPTKKIEVKPIPNTSDEIWTLDAD